MSTLEKHYQREFNQKFKHFCFRFIVITWSLIIVGNLVALGLVYWNLNKGWDQVISDQMDQEMLMVPIGSPEASAAACRDYDAPPATLAAQKNIQPLVQTITKAVLPGVKEYYIPLGSASMKSFGKWTATGMESYLDLGNYGTNVKVYFEASLSIPTANGKVFLRLIQANENFYVPGSEISAEGSRPVIVSSPPLVISSGNKLYKVQIKTSMDYEAVIGFSRLKIVLD